MQRRCSEGLEGKQCWRRQALGKLVTEKPVDFVGFDNVVEFNKNRQNDDNVVKAYKDLRMRFKKSFAV